MWFFSSKRWVIQTAIINHDSFVEAIVQREINTTCMDLTSVGLIIIDVRINRDENDKYWSVIIYQEKIVFSD